MSFLCPHCNSFSMEECGNIFADKEIEYSGFEDRPKKKSRQDYKASASCNRQPKSTWSKLKAVMALTARTE